MAHQEARTAAPQGPRRPGAKGSADANAAPREGKADGGSR